MAASPSRPRTVPEIAEAAKGRLDDLVLITGFSGAGKSTALNAFEDAGYFCVDNLPPDMIRSLVDLFTHEGSKIERAAVVSDVRGGELFHGIAQLLDEVAEAGLNHRVLFLKADEGTLLRRYKETRRRHPLAPEGSVSAGIAAERALLEPLRDRATLVLDSTDLTAAALRKRIAEELLPLARPARLAVTFTSFGHKHGPPRDADVTFDVRFLPNPHWEPELRPLTGLDPRVVEYVGRDGALTEFHRRLHPLLDWLLPMYVAEGKQHLTVAIGCTGGRHRSVAIAEALAARYRETGEYLVDVVHRDVDR
jgi:UPF0042 nucleotide-binding protein